MKTVRKWIKFKYSPRSWEEKSLCYQLFKWIWNRICWRSLSHFLMMLLLIQVPWS